ncbi:MAG: hypothetical protein QOI91_1768 [Solirubrobacteraceae bacterium]|jgi:hypothetical protein|nr:hypothetical protein [Solirubrobacteraceae bacterium]
MHAQRLTAQLLAGPPARDPVAVAQRLLAVQGQDPRGARLAIRARSTGLRAADVDRALTEDRSLLITWLNRGTLHLVRSEDYGWLHALTAPPLFTGNARRLAQKGVDAGAAERGVAVIARALEREGPRTRDQLVERLRSAGVPCEGQAAIHLLFRASLLGIAVRGPMVGRHHAYVLARDWIGATAPVDRDRALAELARRFLAGHGPAGDRDLARWAGLPLRDVRAGLEAIAPELTQRADGLVDLAGRPAAGELPPPRLLGAFDPALLGWVDRAPLLGDHAAQVILGGLFRPFALAGGRAVGVWSWSKGEVALETFGRLSREVRTALEADAADVRRFLAAG